MSVVSSATLQVRRLTELHRRRDRLTAEQQRLQRMLPDWAVEPLKLVGMTGDEIRGLVEDLSDTERRIGLDEIEQEIERIDHQIEDVEGYLIDTPADDLRGVEALLALAVDRLAETTATSPNDVFYDHGSARTLALAERALADLRGILNTAQRRAS